MSCQVFLPLNVKDVQACRRRNLRLPAGNIDRFRRSVIAPGESRPQAHKPLMVSGCFRKPCWLCARQGGMPTCLLNASPVPGRSGIASGQAHDCRACAYGRRSDAVANQQVSPPWEQHASRTPSAFGGSHGPSVSTTRISRSRPCSLVSVVADPAPVSVWGCP